MSSDHYWGSIKYALKLCAHWWCMCCQYAEQILEITKNIELNFMNIIYIVNLSYNLSLIAYQYYNLYNEQVFILLFVTRHVTTLNREGRQQPCTSWLWSIPPGFKPGTQGWHISNLTTELQEVVWKLNNECTYLNFLIIAK